MRGGGVLSTVSGVEMRAAGRRARRRRPLPLVISLFLAALLGAPSAEVGTVTAVPPPAATNAVTVQAVPDAADEPAATPQADVAPTATVVPSAPAAVNRLLDDQAHRAVRAPRGPPLPV